MKYLSLLFACVFVSSSLFAQSDAIDTYFSKYKDDERFTMIYVSPKMFEMFSKVAPEDIDQEVRDLIANLKGLKILISDTESKEFYNEALKAIDMNEYDELMTVRGRGDKEDVKFLVKDSQGGDIVNELLLLVGADEFVMMSFVGNINLKTISKIAKNINIDGMEHLEKLKDLDKNKKN